MAPDIKLGWTPFAMGRILELPAATQDRIEHCVQLISQFTRIGTRVRYPGEHRRRLLCGDFWIVYKLEEAAASNPIETEPDQSDISAKPGARNSDHVRVTIKYLRFNRGVPFDEKPQIDR